MTDRRTGESIRDTRKSLGLTLREVSRKARISAPYLCDIELGRRNAPTGTLERIRAAMDGKASIIKAEVSCSSCRGTGLSCIPLMLVF